MKTTHTFHRLSGSKWFQIALLTIATIATSNCFSQAYKTNDTVHVDEVVISGESISKFQSGAKIEKINQTQFELTQDGNLEQLISRVTPISLKTNAGSFSTIRIRGTAPDHTSINFGGININSLTLGQTNISNVPLYFFDEVGIQFGSSSTVNGSGNIGGAIHLGSKNYWTKGIKGEARISHGSFGEQLYGTKFYTGNGKFESVTRAYYYKKENNFKFKNVSIKDFETGIVGVNDKQHNAAIENMGLLQDINLKFAENEIFTLNIWLQKDYSQTQQNMSTNKMQPNLIETMDENNIRVWSKYQNRKRKFKYQIEGGYAFDNSVHNKNADDTIQTKRIIGQGLIEHDITYNTSYKVGIRVMRIFPKVYAYPNELKYEDRIDAFASFHQVFFKKLKTTVNLRQGYVTNFTIPFTPSIGFSYIALSTENSILKINGNIARSYRVPTFNDRFWLPGGNPDLNPEKGMSYELGSNLSFCNNNTSASIKTNLFYMNIDDWLLWRPGGSDSIYSNYWYAENVQNVISQGIEVTINAKFPINIIKIHSGINYSLTSTKRKKSLNQTNAINRQLEYVPLHSGNIFSHLFYKNTTLTIDGNYTFKQFTNEEEYDILDPYFLLNIALSYKYKVNNDHSLKLSGMINNILNTQYQAYYGYAMPGINYRISLTYRFK